RPNSPGLGGRAAVRRRDDDQKCGVTCSNARTRNVCRGRDVSPDALARWRTIVVARPPPANAPDARRVAAPASSTMARSKMDGADGYTGGTTSAIALLGVDGSTAGKTARCNPAAGRLIT